MSPVHALSLWIAIQPPHVLLLIGNVFGALAALPAGWLAGRAVSRGEGRA
ncbi:hypothetical protein [Marilutibacter maris]|nr:hypothetical protein [Lysobacter maris]